MLGVFQFCNLWIYQLESQLHILVFCITSNPNPEFTNCPAREREREREEKESE